MLLSWEVSFGELCPTVIGEQGCIPLSLLIAAPSAQNMDPNKHMYYLFSQAYPSQKPLASWTRDLAMRVEQFELWASRARPPVLFWLAGFTFPTGFLTAVLQSSARQNNVSKEEGGWDTGNIYFLPFWVPPLLSPSIPRFQWTASPGSLSFPLWMTAT
jgi:hypothetical protein